MDWAQILVIILAVFLALFLLLGVVLLVVLIRLTKQIRTVTTSAERTVRGVEQAVVSFRKVVGPLGVIRLVKKVIRKKKGDSHE